MKALLLSVLLWSPLALGNSQSGDLLIKLAPNTNIQAFMTTMSVGNNKVKNLRLDNWIRVQVAPEQLENTNISTLAAHPAIEFVQPNYKIELLDRYQLENKQRENLIEALLKKGSSPIPGGPPPADNPDFPAPVTQGTGPDPEFSNQWGMADNNVKSAWQKTTGSRNMIVAVIDTGVDYTHEDLLPNIWRNPGESGLDANGNKKATNGIDDDNNGYIDDHMGWDFASDDNKPYDLTTDVFQMLLGGGNPGHGTHCAGNVGARGNNGIGIAGVAPNVQIMALRFITEKGQGTTADAIEAIRYAVDNGAKVLSNSWGSTGEDPNDPDGNKALREAVQYVQDNGGLFVAAAGNGDKTGRGFDNDSSNTPAYPASYDHDTIISVAAIDSNDNLGTFSNWGRRTVDIGAPGVKVFSTVPANKYTDVVIDLPQIGLHATWDGTSMATPHVAGAAALYWSLHPGKTWRQVKDAILGSARRTSSLSSKVKSDGKLDVDALMKF